MWPFLLIFGFLAIAYLGIHLLLAQRGRAVPKREDQ